MDLSLPRTPSRRAVLSSMFKFSEKTVKKAENQQKMVKSGINELLGEKCEEK